MPFLALAYAHTGATGIVKERMDGMKAMNDKLKPVMQMYKGKTRFSPAIAADAATAFVVHGSEMIDLFPDTGESRVGQSTEALPRIWEDWDDFNERAEEFVELSKSFQLALAASQDPDQTKRFFYDVANSCRSCHKLYRKPR